MDKFQSSASNNLDAKANPTAGTQWQTLSPIAILYFISHIIKHLAGNFIYLIPVLAVSYQSISDNPYQWLPAILLLFVLLCLFAVLNFKMYRYRLSNQNIEIRSGILSKKHVNLPFSRVQNVKLEQPFYYRMSGHACVQLDTAGSAKNEAKLVAIKLTLAQQLKQQIQQYVAQQDEQQQANNHTHTEPSEHTNQETLLNRRQLSDLVIHGITSNRIWILLGGMAPFYDNIVDSIGDGLAKLGIDFEALFSLQTHSLLEVALYAISLTMLVMLLLVSLSIAGAIISYYGYTLHRLGDKYIRRSGLITKHEVSMRLSRLQLVVRKQDWLDKALKRINLKLEQINAMGENFNPSASNSKIVVPSIKADECQSIVDDALPNNQLQHLIDSKAFQPISKRFMLRYIGYFFTPLLLLACSFSLANQNIGLIGVFLLIYVLICSWVVLRYIRWGVVQVDQYTYVRKGLIGVDYYCFASYKIQQCQFKQSVLMHRQGLASVKFILASGGISVPMINQELAYQLIDQGLAQVQTSQRSWM